jgi:hypothetical protein
MPRSPAARTSAARDNLAYVDVYRPGTVAKIRAGIPGEVLEVIDGRAGSSWLEFEYDHWLMDGVMQQLGQEEAVRCWHQSIGHLIDKPLLRGFVQGGLRMFGARPGKILKLMPRGWTLAYRDFCVPSFELVAEGHAEIRFTDIAPEAFESEGYLHCWHGICLGVFDLEKPEAGRVEFQFDRNTREALATFTWR